MKCSDWAECKPKTLGQQNSQLGISKGYDSDSVSMSLVICSHTLRVQLSYTTCTTTQSGTQALAVQYEHRLPSK